MRRILLPVVPALLLAVGLTGCGSDEQGSTAQAVSQAASQAASETSSPTSSPAPVVSEADVDSPPTIRFPRDVAAPVQGGAYVAVVLSAGTPDEMDASQTSVAAYGYQAGVSEVGCLQGAAQRLDLSDETLVSSLLFEDQQSARQFADAYAAAEDGSMIGRAAVTAYCLD